MRILMSAASWEAIGLAHQLEHQGFLVSRAETWDDLRYLAAHHGHDALIYSHDLPEPGPTGQGAALLELQRCGAKVVAMRSNAEPAPLLQAGADLVAPKSEPAATLAARVRAAVLRRAGHAPPVIAAPGFALDVVTRQLRIDGTLVPLTPLQYEFVERLALASGRTVSRGDLLDALYGWEDEPGARVLDTFLHGIRQRIAHAGGDPGTIQTRRGAGFSLELPSLRSVG